MNVYQRFLDSTTKAHNIVITTHVYPDADGIGSEIALCLALRALGKNAICVNEVSLLERYKYLDKQDVIISAQEYLDFYADAEVDLFIVTDTNSLLRIGDLAKSIASKAKEVLFVDHHPCDSSILNCHCIDTSKAATGELAGDLIKHLNIPLTYEMALPLYTAILIDTSSFRYPTVSGNTHRVIGSLMDTGVTPPHAYNMIYGTKKLTYMRLLGKVLSSVENTPDEKVAWLILKENQLDRFNVDTEDTHAFINHLLILDNIKVALMFKEMGTMIKVSLRSTGNVDVGVMATALGGGGHDHSAATVIEGKLDDVILTTVNKIHRMLLTTENI